jgi:short-subunit dehydrogenase
MLQLNCIALTELTRHFLPHMLERDTGGVIQIASLAGFVPTPYMAAYGASKAYVLNFTTALAEELRGSQVRMLAVCPGSVPTEFQARAGYLPIDGGATAAVSAETVAATALRAYDRGRHVVVPGKGNAVAAFFSRFGSHGLNARAAGAAMKRAGRDRIGS